MSNKRYYLFNKEIKHNFEGEISYASLILLICKNQVLYYISGKVKNASFICEIHG